MNNRRTMVCADLIVCLVGAFIFALVMACGSHSARAATPEEVDKAIEKAKAYLYSKQQQGNWDVGFVSDAHQEGGVTAIATYALLAAGEKPTDKRLKDAVAYLQRQDIIGIYALGMRAQVWNFLPQTPDVKAAIKRDATLLVTALGKAGEDKGFFGYTIKPNSWSHHSASQYGVLGMWAVAQAGIEIKLENWERVEKAWRDTQSKEGGWCYHLVTDAANPDTVSMTLAGVATLFITNDFLHTADGIMCKGNISNEPIDRGISYLADHFERVYGAYEWYGVERIGVASGYKYIGTIDWYKIGADKLVKMQAADGSWDGYYNNVPGTAMCLLFLTKGRAPVVMNKLQYSIQEDGKTKDASWNQRPRDAANAVKWMAKQAERELNWQVVNLKVDSDDLHDSPILYLSGKDVLAFTPEEEGKLRQFVENGGLILGNADCAEKKFADSFRKLGSKLFPAYEFRELPDDHIVYKNQYMRTKWKNRPSVLGLTNGAREFMILIPTADFAKVWQNAGYSGKEEAWQLLFNIFTYSVDRADLRVKGQTYIVKNSGAKPSTTVKLARLQYPGNWDPEPGGWRRMAAILANGGAMTLETTPVVLGDGKLKDFTVAQLTGTTTFKLEPKQRDELKAFVAAGGTLLVDSTGGGGEFVKSAEEELKAIFGADAAALPAGSPVYTTGPAIPKFSYRNYARKIVGDTTAGRLRGIEIGGRVAVIYSPEDLSVGMVGQPVDGITGYDPATSAKLMQSILMYASAPKPEPIKTADASKVEAPKEDEPKPDAAATPAPATAPATAPQNRKVQIRVAN